MDLIEKLKKGEMPTFPVMLSLDTATIVSLSSVAVIILVLFLTLKKNR